MKHFSLNFRGHTCKMSKIKKTDDQDVLLTIAVTQMANCHREQREGNRLSGLDEIFRKTNMEFENQYEKIKMCFVSTGNYQLKKGSDK